MFTELAESGRPDPCSDPTGAWLQDHEDYLEGRISYDELKRRNCARYRNSPPICGSAKLTDSQRNRALTREQEAADAIRDEAEEKRYRRVRRTAIVWTLLALLVIVFIAVCAVKNQWLVAAVMVQPLIGSIFDALKSIYDWRHFDDE